MKSAALLRERLVDMLREIVWNEEFYKEFEAAVIEELAETTCDINFDPHGGEVTIQVGDGDVFKSLKLPDIVLDCVYVHDTLPQDVPNAKATLNHIDKFIARLQELRTDLKTTIDDLQMASEQS